MGNPLVSRFPSPAPLGQRRILVVTACGHRSSATLVSAPPVTPRTHGNERLVLLVPGVVRSIPVGRTLLSASTTENCETKPRPSAPGAESSRPRARRTSARSPDWHHQWGQATRALCDGTRAESASAPSYRGEKPPQKCLTVARKPVLVMPGVVRCTGVPKTGPPASAFIPVAKQGNRRGP